MSTAFTFPDVKRSSPVTVTGNCPVLNIFKPVAETSLTDGFRNPVYGIVITDQIIPYCGFPDIPGFSCIVNKRCITSPAVRIFMLKLRCIEELSFLIQIDKDILIGILHELTGIRCLCGKASLAINKLYKRKVIVTANSRIIFTKSRCDMNDTGTICHGYIVITGNEKAFLMLLFGTFSCAGIKRFVFTAFQILTLISLKNFISRLIICCQSAKYSIEQCLCHIISITVCSLYLHISFIRVHTECHVGRKCPGCSRPRKEISIFAYCLEADDRGAFLNGLIPLGNLCGRKRGSTTRTVRHDLKALV